MPRQVQLTPCTAEMLALLAGETGWSNEEVVTDAVALLITVEDVWRSRGRLLIERAGHVRELVRSTQVGGYTGTEHR